MDIAPLLERSAKQHRHLCPRQVLGVRIGLAGLRALGFNLPPSKRQMLVIAETDGCLVDGLSAATGFTAGHRTLRIVDYGKVAAAFVDIRSGRAVRVTPVPHLRDRANAYARGDRRAYFVQLQAYQTMPDEEMLAFQDITLSTPIGQILSRPGYRVLCDECSEEIINQREVILQERVLCAACAGHGYYELRSPEETQGAIRMQADCLLPSRED